jgi:cell division protein FtsW (lipid II flippase)
MSTAPTAFSAAPHHTAPRASVGTPRWRGLLELALSLLALGLLWWLAQPLADPAIAQGRNAIYAPTPGADPGNPLAQTRWLQSHVGEVLALWGSTGALVLALARSALPATGFACGAAALWLAAWGVLQTHLLGRAGLGLVWQIGGYNAWWLLPTACVLAWPLLTRLAAALTRAAGGHPAPPQPQRLRSVWLYPGFVLLTGLGVLWLLDYAARGPSFKHLLGWHHLRAGCGAVVVYTVVAGLRLHLLQALAWVLSRVDRVHLAVEPDANNASSGPKRWWRWGVPLLGMLWVLAVVAYGKTHAHVEAITNELLRAPLYLLGGWVVYRWLGAGAGQARMMQGRVWLRLAGLAAVVVLALAVLGDNGPLLVLAYTGCMLSAVLALQAHLQRYPQRSAWLSVALSALLVGALHALLVHGLAPWLSSLGHRLQTMNALNQLPQPMPVLALDFLPRLHWFMQSAPLEGYGLGHTPWCGHAGHLGAACDKGAGVPWEIASDYSMAALVGVWGAPVAWLLWLALVLWLLRLLPQRAEMQHLAQQGSVNLDALGLWAVTLFAVTNLVQAAVTVLGTLAVTPMTGITLPMLSLGASSLWVCAFFAGLGSHVALPHRAVRRVSPKARN